LLRDINRKNY